MTSPALITAVVFCAVLLAAWLLLDSGVRWFSRRQNTAARAAQSDLEGMFIFTDTQRILAVNIALMLVLPLLAWMVSGNAVLAGLALVVAFAAPRLLVRWIAYRRLLRFEQQLPDALMMVAGALRAGASLTIALDSVASEAKPPVSQEFDLLLRELRLGVDFALALEALEKRVPLPDLALVTAGMALSREVGANLAETLESLAKTIRAKLQMEGKIRSLTAQGKLQGIVMSALPALLLVILSVMEPEAMAPMFHAWYGWVTMGVIVVVIAIGYHFIRKITTIDV